MLYGRVQQSPSRDQGHPSSSSTLLLWHSCSGVRSVRKTNHGIQDMDRSLHRKTCVSGRYGVSYGYKTCLGGKKYTIITKLKGVVKFIVTLKGELNPKIKFVLFERTLKITE